MVEPLLNEDCDSKAFFIQLSPIRIAILDTVRYPDEPGVYWITRVNVPRGYRGRGFGTHLLRLVTNWADEHGLVLKLTIQESGGLTTKQLESWYKRYGFVRKKRLQCWLRQPNPPMWRKILRWIRVLKHRRKYSG